MATSFGMDPIVNGASVTGTTSADIRQIFGAMFNQNQGVVQGAKVTLNANRTYTISDGLVLNYLGAPVNGHVLTPVYASTVTAPAATSGDAIHYIYVRQNVPSKDGNNGIVYGVSTSDIGVDDPRIVISSFKVPKNYTRTNQATRINYGNLPAPIWSVGTAGYVRDTFGGNLSARATKSTSLIANLPQGPDRSYTIDIDLSARIITGSAPESLYVYLIVNGVRRAIFSTGLLSPTGQTYHWSWRGIGGGRTTVKLEYWSKNTTADPSNAQNKKSKILFLSSSTGWTGTTVHVADQGSNI